MSTTEPASSDATSAKLRTLPLVAKALAYPLVALVLVHSLLIALWVAPSTPIREELGTQQVRSYILPWFDQNWSIFAPNPRRTAVTLEIRAMVETSQGEQEPTDWVDLVAVEDEMVSGNLFGGRTSKIARRLTDRIHSAWSNMNDEQREWLQADYVETPVEQLADRLHGVSGGAGDYYIDRYMRADQAATALATAAAHHLWDQDIIHVQYRTSYRSAVPWEDRHALSLDEREKTYRNYGWRAPAQLREDQLAEFTPYAERIEARP